MRLKNQFRDMRTIRTLLEGAEAEANRAGESMPGAEHLLLSVAPRTKGAYRSLGIDIDTLAAAAREEVRDTLAEKGGPV
jgi:hypothetical protein